MSILVYDLVECPSCGATVPIRLMSLCATCACGMYYADVDPHRGWYSSWEAYANGREPLSR